SLARHTLKENATVARRVEETLRPLGLRYEGRAEARHLLQILVEDLGGAERLKPLIRRPLTGLKVGAFYGCHLLRPHDHVEFDDPEDPHSFEDVIRALGAEPVDYRGRCSAAGSPSSS
ncbi:succinate dehydrogenase subunit C, partial [mine drainage metagenome]